MHEPYNPVKEVVIDTIKQHIPSLTDEDEDAILERMGMEEDVADFALRTCACGRKIDGYYDYVDHLTEVFGGESHLAS